MLHESNLLSLFRIILKILSHDFTKRVNIVNHEIAQFIYQNVP